VEKEAEGMMVLQEVAERIVARHLELAGRFDVQTVSKFEAFRNQGIDITYAWESGRRNIKVKPDPYFGTDPAKVSNRSLVFYRAEAGSYAFESVANSATRAPGWIVESEADDLYYYYLALAQEEDEVRALLAEPDDVLFSELKVERDDLRILPMAETRRWFESHAENYTPRPVMLGTSAAWFRLVPRSDIEQELPGIKIVGPIFARMAH
jgi:hypothetical protein